MEQLIFQQIRNELINGSVKKKHPFRFFTFGTTSGDKPMLRTVVLRKTYPDLRLEFYTDERSQKVEQVVKNNQVAAIFYHPTKLLQLQIAGSANIISDPERISALWKTIPEHAQKDYTTSSAPGAQITTPDRVEYLRGNHHFCIVEIIPETIEYLRLKRPNHIRIKFQKPKGEWKGEFLVP
ncbi:MAG: pyridoxamine 5'-phosphate oxidase family protein [Bacteroidota bacterium]